MSLIADGHGLRREQRECDRDAFRVREHAQEQVTRQLGPDFPWGVAVRAGHDVVTDADPARSTVHARQTRFPRPLDQRRLGTLGSRRGTRGGWSR